MNIVRFTKFTSGAGPLAKIVSKAADGSLSKKASAQMYRGQFETVDLDTGRPGAAIRLSELLSGFLPTQALSASLSLGADTGAVVTQQALTQHPGAVARDSRHFGYRPGTAGLLVLDYDPPKGVIALEPADLWQRTLDLWPEVAAGIVVHMHSASSLIFDGDRQVWGIAGQRLYIAIQAQADIPRALKVLNSRAWLKGLGGHIHISRSGVALVRHLFDSAMADAGGRLDFAPAGAVCRDGLEQRRPPPTVLADGQLLDTRSLQDLSAAEEAEFKALIERARQKAEPEIQTVRAEWLLERQQCAAMEAVKNGQEPDEARQRVKRDHDSLLNGVLTGTAELVHVNDDGAEVIVTVQELLSDPKGWHGKHFLSPHEPDHRDRSPDAMAYLLQAVPILFDLNDLVKYHLQRSAVSLQFVNGERAALADRVATALADRSDLFNLAGNLVRVAGGEFLQVNRPMLQFIAGTHCSLYRRNKDGKTAPMDFEHAVIDMVQPLLSERAKKIMGRSSIPLIDPAGRVISGPGFDEKTGFYIETEVDFNSISTFNPPTRQQTIDALRRLWAPFSLYSWTSEHCRAAMLATILTVPLRPTIDAAPGLFVDSASAGAGKSSACRALMMLIQGQASNLKTWSDCGDVELEKHLLSIARSGASVVAYDNVLGTFDSAAISTAVTEGMVSARQLGATTALSLALRATWLASGNQASLGRDCGTRFLQARIASDGSAHRKSFPFEPSQAALADRLGIVQSIISVHSAWHAAGCPREDGINTRFAQWGSVIRPMVAWLRTSGLAQEAGIGPLGDPADSILNRESASDPDTDCSTALLSALHGAFGDATPFTASEVTRAARAAQSSSLDDTSQALFDALLGFYPKGPPSPQSVASLLRNRRERVYAGLKLTMPPKPPTREAARAAHLFAVVEV